MDDKIKQGLNVLLTRDSYLLINDVSERSITHKLGEYYQYIFPEWNVDCEYNKFLGGPKTLGMNIHALLNSMEYLLLESIEAGSINSPEEKKLSAYIGKHKKHIKLAGYLIDTHTAKSLYEDIRSDNRKVDEIAGMVYIAIKESNRRNDGQIQKRSISPDMIIHHRGSTNNHVIIEAKKSTNPHDKAWLFDLLKLLALTSSQGIYRYAYGYFINIPASTKYKSHSSFDFEKQSKLFTKVESA